MKMNKQGIIFENVVIGIIGIIVLILITISNNRMENDLNIACKLCGFNSNTDYNPYSESYSQWQYDVECDNDNYIIMKRKDTNVNKWGEQESYKSVVAWCLRYIPEQITIEQWQSLRKEENRK